jgi:hypothetical protein
MDFIVSHDVQPRNKEVSSTTGSAADQQFGMSGHPETRLACMLAFVC